MSITDIAEMEWNKGLDLEALGDYKTAIEHYTKASELGHSVAQINLANIYDDQEQYRNVDLALYWYHKSFDAGEASAAWNLCMHYKALRSLNMAVYWADKADVSGHPDGLEEASRLRAAINNAAN